jgi:signal transduction histidine kinase/CheY-like chemotaxis protein
MNRSPEYVEMITERADQIGIRLIMAIFLGGAGYVLQAGPVPVVWFGLVCITQLVEYLLIDTPIRRRKPDLSRLSQVLITLVSGFNATLFASLAVYIWFCGPAGELFATMLICGSLLHVCMHLYSVRAVQIVGAAGPVALLFGLPVYSYWLDHGFHWTPIILMILAAALFLAHLLAGVTQSHRINASLVAANAYAEQQRSLAEAESRSKSNFLATISHEIRTPLNAVTTAANLLKDTDMTERQAEYVSILLNGSEVLLGLINQVLDMSKIEAGKMTLELGHVTLQDMADKLLSLWKAPAEQHGLTMQVHLAPELPPAIHTDGLRLSQVLFNLVSNAVKFTEQGSVEVNIRPDVHTDRPDQRLILFEVIDTGPGLPPGAVERLFDSFEQADAGTTRRFGGTGLGLAISRRLAELMGGELSVESRLGAGSSFRLTLPLVEGVVAGAPSAPEVAHLWSDEDTAPLSILIAEDHAVNRRLLSLLLEPLKANLTMVENGLEAVEAARQRPFHAILMDLQMPIMSGLEATRLIRSEPGPNVASPIIALTANAFDEQRQIWMDAGADAFLTKPIDPPVMLSTLMNLLMTERRSERPQTDQSAPPAAQTH